MLHPSYKTDYWRMADWEAEWIDEGVELVKDVLRRDYADIAADQIDDSMPPLESMSIVSAIHFFWVFVHQREFLLTIYLISF